MRDSATQRDLIAQIMRITRRLQEPDLGHADDLEEYQDGLFDLSHSELCDVLSFKQDEWEMQA